MKQDASTLIEGKPFLLLSITLMLLCGCVKGQRTLIVEPSEQRQVVATEPTRDELIEKCKEKGCAEKRMECGLVDGNAECFCTELGCVNYLVFEFNNEIPSNYIIEVTDEHNLQMIKHCFERGQVKLFPYSSERYRLDDPNIEKISQVSPVIGMCKDNSGTAQTTVRSDGSIAHIIAYCSEFQSVVDQTEWVIFSSSSCARTGVAYDYFAYPMEYEPGDISVTLYWDDNIKIMEIDMKYDAYNPNGPECPPTCITGRARISIP